MTRLKKVTFTGVDYYTSAYQLQCLQKKYPYAEFGVLFSPARQCIENRYPTPYILPDLVAKGLKLSAHLCGRFAEKVYVGDWSEFDSFMLRYFDESVKKEVLSIFSRCQLNLASTKMNKAFTLSPSCSLPKCRQFIIQQRSATECPLYELSKANSFVVLLCDASGGKGIDTPINVYEEPNKLIGYAGGINKDNVKCKLDILYSSEGVGDFWIDMESSVRDKNDRFDLEAVERVLEIVDRYIDNEL